MPSPEKDRPSGRLGRLLAALRPSRAGPLPVQTGFPTSLADLVVKNHGRLKKQPSPSSKRRKSRGGSVSSASPSPSTSPSPPPSSPPPPAPPPRAAAAASIPDRPRPDLSRGSALRREKSGGFGLGLGFLAVGGVVSLALLVIWSKKVVAAVTIASFSLFLLESLRCASLTRRQRRRRLAATPERQLYLDGRGRVSPIREVEPARRPSCSDSERGIEEAAAVLADAEEKSGGILDESSESKARTKRRSWKKLIASAKKLHKGRKSTTSKDAADCSGGSFLREEREVAAGSSFRSECDRDDDASVRGDAKGADSSGSRCGMVSKTDAIVREPDSLGSRRRRSSGILEVDARADLTKQEEEAEQEQEKAGIRFPGLVLVAVALVGLVAGKLPAVAFTMLCAAFFSSVPRFSGHRGEGWRWRRLEGAPRVIVGTSL